MVQDDLTVLSKSKARKTLRKGIGNHEVGPKWNESHNTSSMKARGKNEGGCQCGEKISGEQDW